MKTIEELRKEIDGLDDKLLKVLSKRVIAVKEIGKIKRAQNIELLNESRKAKVLQRWLNHPINKHLSDEVIEAIYQVIHDISIEIEKK
jgi:chorismate mutase